MSEANRNSEPINTRFANAVRRKEDPSTEEILHALSIHDVSPAAMERRRFLQGAIALGGAAALSPVWSPRPAGAQGRQLAGDERILLTILMGGGNDGFKMVAPLDNATFVGERGSLADSPADSHALGDGLYLNPFLPGIKSLWDEGQVACVLGVGNPADSRSHFESMAMWMAGQTSRPYVDGWLGRHVDGAGYAELGSIAIGTGVPLHLVGRNQVATGLSPQGVIFGASDASWVVRRYGGIKRYASGPSGLSPWVDRSAEAFSNSIDVAGSVGPAYDQLDPGDQDLARELVVAAGLINADIGVRVINTSFGSFDHHDDQPGIFALRMTELDTAIRRFYETLAPGLADRVVIATFSEFGRSFTPNGSNGTDHGTASNMMVIGRNVNGGVYGEMPDFTSLDDRGDVHHTVDFRSYYASLLDGWLGSDANEVLGGSYENLQLFDAAPTAGSGTAVLRTSCLNNDGRFDVDIVNVGTEATFELEVGDLPPRTVRLAPGASTTMTVTGRQDRSWPVRVLRDGTEIMNESVTVNCDPARAEVEVDQSCLATNGRYDIHLRNGSATAAEYTMELTGLARRAATVAPGAYRRVSWTGRPDGDYTVRVWRNGTLVLREEAAVSCDPAGEPIRVETSCLAGNGRVDIHLHNDSANTVQYGVTIGSLATRFRTVGPGGRTRISATGRPDGPLEVVVAAAGTELHRSSHTIACGV